MGSLSGCKKVDSWNERQSYPYYRHESLNESQLLKVAKYHETLEQFYNTRFPHQPHLQESEKIMASAD